VSRKWALGVDVGSVTAKFVLLDENGEVRMDTYVRTMGDPLQTLVENLDEVRRTLPDGVEIGALGTTGSGRRLAGVFLGADLVKNEITAQTVGTLSWRQDIRTIVEIGGQDSKIIHLKDGMVVDFAMNTVCAAGTGAFIDQQAARLRIPIDEFGAFALRSERPVRIAGRCSVFAESDMISKQQAGYDKASICIGLCQALVRNYLNNVARGRRLHGPISFQGGVARNEAILKCFQKVLPDAEIVRPPQITGRGAIGAAILAREKTLDGKTAFRGWQVESYSVAPSPCGGCAYDCDAFTLTRNGLALARWGGRCERGNEIR
jgi:predicted CoA-substrate-specific enzyme activase